MKTSPVKLSDIVKTFFEEKKLSLVLIPTYPGSPEPDETMSPWSIYERPTHPRGAAFGFVSNRRGAVCLYRTWFGYVDDIWMNVKDPNFLNDLYTELDKMLNTSKLERCGPNVGR